MTFFSRRRLLLAGFYVVSLAAGAAVAWYIGRNLTGIGPISQRQVTVLAEAECLLPPSAVVGCFLRRPP
jgi:hypothetical protein